MTTCIIFGLIKKIINQISVKYLLLQRFLYHFKKSIRVLLCKLGKTFGKYLLRDMNG